VSTVVSVDVGLKLPHAPEGAQVQVTPAVSFVVAENIAVALVTSEVGTPERLTVMAVIVMVAEADLLVSVTDVAVTVTVPLLGTADGAV
jgi:hypothetical protein